MGSAVGLFRRALREGTPLVDPIRGKPHKRRLTLVFEGDRKTRSVSVMGNLTGWDVEQGRMSRVGRSNVWSWSRVVEDDLRTTYRIGPNDTMVPFSQERHWKRRQSAWRLDPLNSQRYALPRDPEVRGDKDWVESLVALPGAPRDPLTQVRARVPHGTVSVHRLNSRFLRNTRRAWLYSPPRSTRATGASNLVIAFDGRVHTEIIPVPTLLDNLLARGEIGPTWMVSVDSLTQKERSRELHCYPPFVSFLSRELLPWVRRRVHHPLRPDRTVLAGQSAGGVAAVHALLERPHLFGHVLSQSGAFGYPSDSAEPERLARQVADANLGGRRFYLEAGTLETTVWSPTAPSLLLSNRHMRDVLRAKGHHVEYREFHGGHDYSCWRESFSTGLRWCLPHP